MKIENFKLERYFSKYEFETKYLLSSSDCDGYSLDYMLGCASDEEMNLWSNLKLGYTECEGSQILRKTISKFYSTCDSDNVLVAAPNEIAFITMNVLLNPNDHVICVSPAYQALYQVVRSIGCDLSFWEIDRENWHFNPDDLEKLIKKTTKLIIINFPHNPTGAYPSREELDKITEIAKNNNIYLYSDEMYYQLMLNGTRENPPICDLYEKGISLWGTSKSFGLAGLRTGWVVSHDKELLKRILAFKDYLTICTSGVTETLTLIALNNKEKFIDPNLTKIHKNIEFFEAFQKKHSDIIKYIAPKAGSVAAIELNIKEPSLDFSNRLVKEEGIMTVPAEMFGFEGKFLRVGFGRENFLEVLEKFDAFLVKYKMNMQ